MASMLTTVDNPYDPVTNFPAWYRWDMGKGYNTCAYLARVAAVPDAMPDSVVEAYTELAMDEIIAIHNGGLYKKVPVPDDLAPSVA